MIVKKILMVKPGKADKLIDNFWLHPIEYVLKFLNLDTRNLVNTRKISIKNNLEHSRII